MTKSLILLGTLAILSACAQSGKNAEANNESQNDAAAAPPKTSYCFFQDSETKNWKAKLDGSGNVVVSGEAYREDPRYRALLSPATVKGDRAEVSPTIEQNETGFAAPENWWKLSQTIPGSKGVRSVVITCGDRTLATLALPRTK